MNEKEMCPPLSVARGSELPVHVTWAALAAWVALPLISQEKQGHQMTVPAAAVCASWVMLNRAKFILAQGDIAYLNRAERPKNWKADSRWGITASVGKFWLVSREMNLTKVWQWGEKGRNACLFSLSPATDGEREVESGDDLVKGEKLFL